MVAMLGVAADSSDLLLEKGVKPRGKKAQKCKQLALACSADEVQAFHAEKEAETLAAAKKQKREPGQLSMEETEAHAQSLHARLRPRAPLGPPGQRGVPRSLPPLQCNPGVRRAGVSAQAYMAAWKALLPSPCQQHTQMIRMSKAK